MFCSVCFIEIMEKIVKNILSISFSFPLLLAGKEFSTWMTSFKNVNKMSAGFFVFFFHLFHFKIGYILCPIFRLKWYLQFESVILHSKNSHMIPPSFVGLTHQKIDRKWWNSANSFTPHTNQMNLGFDRLVRKCFDSFIQYDALFLFLLYQ